MSEVESTANKGQSSPHRRAALAAAPATSAAGDVTPIRPVYTANAKPIASLVDVAKAKTADPTSYIAATLEKVVNWDRKKILKKALVRVPDQETEMAILSLESALSRALGKRVTQEEAILFAIHVAAAEVRNKIG